MCNQACVESPDGITGHKSLLAKQKATLALLPCTVSQLLTAAQVGQDGFAICDWELHQVSILGVVRKVFPIATHVRYSVDDMTGPPLTVKQWVNAEDYHRTTLPSPGTYVKVTGSLRNSIGQRSLLAVAIRCIEDLNEITSHMLEVVHAHMLWFGKTLDVNMNPTAAPLSGRALGRAGGCPQGVLPYDLSTIHSQVLNVIRTFSAREPVGISFQDLKAQLDYIRITDIRTSLAFLMSTGHIHHTIDEQHFKSTEY